MRNVIAIAVILFTAQGALAETRSIDNQAHVTWKPVIGGAASDRVVTETAPVSVQRTAARSITTSTPVTTWSAQVEYQHVIDRPDLLAAGARNEETKRPGFATVQRSFGSGEFRPYVGVGVGAAATQFDTIMPSTEDAFAIKGVVGSNLTFTDKVGGYMQYDYAVATQREAATGARKSHGLSFGLRISLQ